MVPPEFRCIREGGGWIVTLFSGIVPSQLASQPASQIINM